MIELQNEQLANCLSFDEETFNYPLVEKVPYCLKLICPFWLLPCPRGLSVSGYLLLLPTRPAATLAVHAALLQRQPQAERDADTILFVECSSKIGAFGAKMKGCARPPSLQKDQAGQFPLTLSCPGVRIPSAHKGRHWTGPDTHSLVSASQIINGGARLLSPTPF